MAEQTGNIGKGGFLPEGAHRFLRRRGEELAGLVLLVAAGALAVALTSFSPNDPSWNAASSGEAANILGYAGAVVADILLQTLGLASAVAALIIAAWGWRMMSHRALSFLWLRITLLPVGLLSLSCALAVLPTPDAWPLRSGLGGFFGSLTMARLVDLLPAGQGAAPVTLLGLGFAVFAVAVLIWCFGSSAGEWWSGAKSLVSGARSATRIGGDLGGKLGGKLGEVTADAGRKLASVRREPTLVDGAGNIDDEEPEPVEVNTAREPTLTAPREMATGRVETKKAKPAKSRRAEKERQTKLDLGTGEYQLPALNLLDEATEKGVVGPDKDALEANARMLEAVLQDFGVKGEIVKVRYGPVVTLYELEPAPGTKSSRVIGLSDDIARSMSAISVRVAVVPGRNAIGIELPNARRVMVYLRELFEFKGFEQDGHKLGIALGKDIAGAPVVVDLAKMPHLLIAGTTGSGKSVAVNTMILSMLYRLTPEQCRFIMIDPKMLELSIYDGIPHLLSPVVTDPKKAVVALKWTVREMENRYRAMSKLGVRNIDGYNARLADARKKGEVLKRKVQTGFDADTGKPVFEEEALDLTALPYIVVVIDEVADLMLVAGKDIEGAVQRLAQMARAAGIHVIMATQRPSVDVITGTIKANFPTRISFQVTSKIDSRTILGEQGAEQLLGQGDMLYMAGGGRVTRVHGPFVSDEEVEDVVRHLKAQGEPEYNETITEEDEGAPDILGMSGGGDAGSTGDDTYDQAVALVAREGKASTSFIQRHLKIGYNRAATIIEKMESEGVVSAANHVGKREVLVGDHSVAH